MDDHSKASSNISIKMYRREDAFTRSVVDHLLDSFLTKEEKLYWLGVLVKLGRVSQTRAGQIIIERGLL